VITATVRPDGRQAIVPVISDPEVERDGKLVETRTDVKAGIRAWAQPRHHRRADADRFQVVLETRNLPTAVSVSRISMGAAARVSTGFAQRGTAA
jgi:hypothetical protein